MRVREALKRLVQFFANRIAFSERKQRFDGAVFHSALQPGIDPKRMNQLVDELEIEEFSRRSHTENK